VRAGEETLRRSIAAAGDGRARARLRVELAGLVRIRDAAAARDELTKAVREGGATPAVALAAISLGRTLPPPERIAWLGTFTAPPDAVPVPGIAAALADASVEANRPRDAALTLLALARDGRVPVHHRRVAARRAVRLAGGLEPALELAVLRAAATLASGRSRRELLRRALALPDGADRDAPEDLAGAALDWLQDGGTPRLAEETLARLREGRTGTPAVDRLAAALATRLPPKPAPRRDDAAPARPRRATPRGRPEPAALFEAALVEARAGRAARARRLGEEAIRLSPSGPALVVSLNALDTALREGGFLKDGLRLCRTYLEAVRDETARREALIALAAEADAAGLGALAASWRGDAGVVLPSPATAAAEPVTPADHYLAAQRLLAGRTGDDVSARVLAHLERALAGHPGSDAALALAEKLAAEVAGRAGGDVAARRLDLLRAAHAAEYEPARRARLGWRLAAQLESVGDAIGAVAVLERALAESAPGDGARVRGERARLLRSLGRSRELAVALEKDAGALLGDARLPVLAEHAELLEAAGEAERALDVRLMALAEFPGAPAVLDEARRRLEATGRAAESLALASAALDHTSDRARRLQLLRDVARLGESLGADANPTEAANAWLAVLEIDPTDATAAAAAERLLVATGDWERCADLLAWQVARAGADPAPTEAVDNAREALLWRLAELRRAHLGQGDEALRLYGQLAARDPALGPLVDPPELAAFVRRDAVLATETARAAVAPTAADRARAFVDRAVALVERGRRADAERDALGALDLDPRNAGALGALERLFEGEVRARALAEELGRRAAKLPPVEAAPLYLGRGRAAERAGERIAAREAYRRAMSLDPTFAEPVAALGALAAREGDWSEVAALLESELGLATSAKRKGPLLLELAVVYGDHLGAPARAVSLLETAAGYLPDEPRLLDLSARFNLQAGNWQPAADALDRLAARGAAIADAAERYFSVGAAAEAAGQADRALTLYSRSYGRDAGYRPTLERLSALCFERGQWDNAWKATEALLERHGAALSPAERAALLMRSLLADLHIGQRTAAVAKLRAIVTRGPSYIPDAGIRDVAESWAGMHLEPRLLVDIEARRRERVLGRATEVLALEAGADHPARRQALEVLGALAVAEGRWVDAIAALEELSADTAFSPERRSDFLLAAGDIFARAHHDPAAAQTLYDRARELWPGNSSLLRPSLTTPVPGA
jgi:tetratricopeptide (TPR) repeat protein